MAWLSPALGIGDVQKRFPIIKTNAIPPEIITTAIDDAEQLIRPFCDAVWGSGVTTNGTIRMLTIQLCAAMVYRSVWGMQAFGADIAAQAADNLESWVFKRLDEVKSSGELSGAARLEVGVTNAGDTSGVFSLGSPDGWVEPTDEIAADVTERRTF